MKIKNKLCSTCNKEIAQESRPCPYSKERYGKIKICNCCNKCYQNCLDET